MSEIVTISGPAGVGKGTLVELVTKWEPDAFLSISCTTREVRPGETPEVSYHYITRERFEEMAAGGEFFEYASVHGNLYGTPIGPVERALMAGRNVLLEIDVQGSMQVISKYPDTKSVFVLPPSFKELEHRIRERNRDTAADISSRLKKAAWEIEQARKCAYIVINDERERAARDILRIVRGEPCPELTERSQAGHITSLLTTFEEVD